MTASTIISPLFVPSNNSEESSDWPEPNASRSLDEYFPDKNGDIAPEKFDVVCGRDRFSQRHVGNKRFRIVIEMHRESYQNAPSRDIKTRITREIVTMMRQCRPGGRFLKLDEDTNEWYDVGDDYAKEKVSHALRSAKDPNRKRVPIKRKVPKKKNKSLDYQSEKFLALFAMQRQIFQDMVVEQNEGLKNFPTPSMAAPVNC